MIVLRKERDQAWTMTDGCIEVGNLVKVRKTYIVIVEYNLYMKLY